MSFTLKNGTACRTLGMSEACSSIATSKSVLLSVAISYLLRGAARSLIPTGEVILALHVGSLTPPLEPCAALHNRADPRARRLQAVVRQLARMLQYRRDVFD